MQTKDATLAKNSTSLRYKNVVRPAALIGCELTE